MTDKEKEQLKQYILEHKDQAKQIVEAIEILSSNKEAKDLILAVIEHLENNGGEAELLGAELLKAFVMTSEQESKKNIKAVQKRTNAISSSNDKVSNALFGAIAGFDSELFYTKEGDITLKAGEIKGKPVKILARLDLEELLKTNSILISREFTAFDREILDTVTSLYALAGNRCFNENMIYHALTGYCRRVNTTMPEGIKKAIKESLYRLRYTSIRINATNEAENFNYPALKSMKRAVFEGYLLPLNSVDIEFNNGESVEGYEVLKTPPLYDYAHSKQQVISCKVSQYALPESINATPQTIVIRGYLLREIEKIKHSHDRNNVIRFDTLFAYLKVDESAQTVRIVKQRIRATVYAILDTWKLSGDISGYEEIAEGRKIVSVKILISGEGGMLSK